MKKLLYNLFFILVNLVTTSVFSQTNYFVKTSGTDSNDGASWSSATTLNGALSRAASGDIIHVAQGTYMPTSRLTNGTEDKDKTFEIKQNITLIGGYPLEATQGATADPVANKTILSGVIDETNSVYHTVTITAPVEVGNKVTIQGLIITKGNANGTGNVTIDATPYLRNYAGGVAIAKSTVEMTNCKILENNSTNAAGIYLFSEANLTMSECEIMNNAATGNGGGIWITGSTAHIYNSTISGNTTSGTGVAAGLYTYNKNTKVYMYNSTINSNTSGGNYAGAYIREGSEVYLINSTIFGNTSGGTLGTIGIHSTATANTQLSVISSTITGNTTSGTAVGGGISQHSTANYSTIKILNSLISGNSAPETNANINANPNFSKVHTIIGDKIYSTDGTEKGDLSFNPATMLEALKDNGGKTQTCLLIGENNPARTHGMSQMQLTALASTYIPELSAELISKDQIGNSRSDCSTIGALVLKKIASSVYTPTLANRKIYSYHGVLHVETLDNENITLYSITGHLVHSQKAVDSLTKISGLAKGIYVLKINNQSLKIRI